MPEDLDPMYAPPAASPPQVVGTSDRIGWLLLATPAVAGIVNTLLPVGKHSTALFMGAILLTTALINLDAMKLRQHPIPWIYGALCMFVITYPVYMHYRTKWGAPRRFELALVAVTLMFAGPIGRAVASVAVGK